MKNKLSILTCVFLFFLLFLSGNLQAELPDLSVNSITLTPDCRIRVVMENKGGAVSLDDFENAAVHIMIGGQSSSPVLTSFDPEMKLKPAGGVLVKILSNTPFTTGRVKVGLDTHNAIQESNTNNNIMWISLRCPSYEVQDYGSTRVISVNGFRLLDGCGIELELKNIGSKLMNPDAYNSSSPYGVYIGISWGNIQRAMFWLNEIDANKTLQHPGAKLKCFYSNAKLGNKTFRGTLVKAYTGTPRGSGHISERIKELWCLPDLAVTAITHKPSAPRAGDRIGIKVHVKNKSQVSSPPCKLRFKIGGESRGKIFNVPAMAPNKTRYYDRQFQPSRANSYSVKAFVDYNDQVEEITEKNNKRTIYIKVRPAYPDLQVTKIEITPACNVKVTVKNNGPGYVPNSVWAANVANNSDVFLYLNGRSWGGVQIRTIDPRHKLQPPGGSVSYTFNLKVSLNTVIKAIVDRTKKVTETREYNNELSKTLSCVARLRTTRRTKR